MCMYMYVYLVISFVSMGGTSKIADRNSHFFQEGLTLSMFLQTSPGSERTLN